MRFTLISTALLALAACAHAGKSAPADTDPEQANFTYRCDHGASFTARYVGDDNSVIVVAGSKTYRLPGAIAASGARYFDGHVEYWEHHGEAMLNGAAGGSYDNCRSVAP